MEIRLATDIHRVKCLFREYAASLHFDLTFQDFEQELAGLPGHYSRPDGCLLTACIEDREIGCAGLRKLSETVCEIKRLYVIPEFRGRQIGRSLVKAVIDEGKKIGYKKIRLDTVPSMKPALLLYESFGFKDIPPYRYNPLKGTRYLELDI